MRIVPSFLAIYLASCFLAQAQMVLPGAVPAQPSGKPGQKFGADGKPIKRQRPAAVSVKTPGEDGVTARELTLNGFRGRIELAKAGDGLNVTRLVLEGNQISRPDDICRVDVVSGTPLAAKAMGRPAGAVRYGVELETCPISFDVLDGAILVSATPAICEFKAADCRVTAAGLWGPRGASIGPDRVKDIERARTQTEATMRENFRALLARTTVRAQVKAVAAEQAGFTSVRAEICRDYAREDIHGFCALRLTEARALLLRVEIAGPSKEGDGELPARKKKRRGAVPL